MLSVEQHRAIETQLEDKTGFAWASHMGNSGSPTSQPIVYTRQTLNELHERAQRVNKAVNLPLESGEDKGKPTRILIALGAGSGTTHEHAYLQMHMAHIPALVAALDSKPEARQAMRELSDFVAANKHPGPITLVPGLSKFHAHWQTVIERGSVSGTTYSGTAGSLEF